MYETPDGNIPFKAWMDWLEKHKIEAYGVVMTRLDRIADGNFSNCEPVGEGVSELKIDFGPGYRVYFGQIGNEIVVLLTGGTKQTQKADIKLAKEYWRAFDAE
jgi:putative addiction module killer protein